MCDPEPVTQQAHDPSNPAPDAAAWHQQIAALIDHLDSGEFFPVLLQALAYQAPRLSTIIFLFRQRDVPQVVYHDVPAKEVGANIDSYVAGAYLLSPLYAAHQNNLHGFFITHLFCKMIYTTQFDIASFCDRCRLRR